MVKRNSVTKIFYISNSQYISISLTAPGNSHSNICQTDNSLQIHWVRDMQARRVHQIILSKMNTLSKFGMSSRWTLKFGFMLWQKWC